MPREISWQQVSPVFANGIDIASKPFAVKAFFRLKLEMTCQADASSTECGKI